MARMDWWGVARAEVEFVRTMAARMACDLAANGLTSETV